MAWCALAGVTFSGRQEILDKIWDGRENERLIVKLYNEEENEYDPNAVAVYYEDKKSGIPYHLGYIPRKITDYDQSYPPDDLHVATAVRVGTPDSAYGVRLFWNVTSRPIPNHPNYPTYND